MMQRGGPYGKGFQKGAPFSDPQWYTPLLKSYQKCTVPFRGPSLTKDWLQYDHSLLRTKYNT